MEYRCTTSKKNPPNEEKIIRSINYLTNHAKQNTLVLEILQKGLVKLHKRASVTGHPKHSKVKTYVAERKYCSSIQDLGSLIAIGENYIPTYTDKSYDESYIPNRKNNIENYASASSVTDKIIEQKNKCKHNKATLIITSNNSSDSEELTKAKTKTYIINLLNQQVGHLRYKKFRKKRIASSSDQMVLSSDDEPKSSGHSRSKTKRTYVNQYSHVAEKSAFNRIPPSASTNRTTVENNHNTDQYGQNFTTYDEMTARGHRQTSTVPTKKNDIPRRAAERINKVRHKLNPVRDYKLMDTVHYLAQGEFAPRDDGVKLTPSREAVLSDIIWEDVCRTNWPNTRLTRRGNTRYELQRLIDGLLRERVAHVERRRRKHCRMVKLNHRFEIGNKILGKTGDIIVATQKKREGRNVVGSDHITKAVLVDANNFPIICLKNHKSHDPSVHYEEEWKEGIPKRRFNIDESLPGPSTDVHRCVHGTLCIDNDKKEDASNSKDKSEEPHTTKKLSNKGTCVGSKVNQSPRLRLPKKNDTPKRKSQPKNITNLEHFIVLPTLVVRTPSNVRRQKKFNELYNRILNKNRREDNSNDQDDIKRKKQLKKYMRKSVNGSSSDSNNED